MGKEVWMASGGIPCRAYQMRRWEAVLCAAQPDLVWFLWRQEQEAKGDEAISKHDLGTAVLVTRILLWGTGGKGVFPSFSWTGIRVMAKQQGLHPGKRHCRTLRTSSSGILGTQNTAQWVGHQNPCGGAPSSGHKEGPSLSCLQSRFVCEGVSVTNGRRCFCDCMYECPGNFWNNWGEVSCGEESAEPLCLLGVGEDGKESATFSYLMWSNLTPEADGLGRLGDNIYNTVNLETDKIPNTRGLVKWIITHPNNVRRGYNSKNKCVYFLWISQPHYIHSHCYPQGTLRPQWAEAMLREIDCQSKDRNIHVCRACPLFFYQQAKMRNTTAKANGDRQGTHYIVPWVKNFPRHRLTIEFMIERDRGC